MSELPFTPAQIAQARDVPLAAILSYLGAYVKRDDTYHPLDRTRRSLRLHVNFEQRDFRFILTGDKFVNELLPKEDRNRGGGGAIDFVKHLTGVCFLPAVKVCLDAAVTETQIGASK